ncbi:MAG: RusA family crossover junction endodeoxyribonuclease [Desulfomicrobium sp.]|nr:RusA family crossover junction endodeoxyribonuclease [Desulfomicrobium sp.]
MIKFTIPLEPVGQMRARHTARGGFSRTYKAPKQRMEEHKLLVFALQHRPREPLEGPLRLSVRAYMPIPKSYPRLKKSMARNQEIRPAKKPDVSNIAKHLEDCFNGIFWRDDAQVVELLVSKHYSDDPRWEIEIREWE